MSGFDIAHPFELARIDALGLLVQRDKKVLSIKGIANRDDGWMSFCIAGSQAANSLSMDKADFGLG